MPFSANAMVEKPEHEGEEKPKPGLAQRLRLLFKPKAVEHTLKEALEEALEEVIEEHEEQSEEVLPAEEKNMLRNVLSFSERTVADIMIPRTDIVAIPLNISLHKLKTHIIEQRHTRTPVFAETLDKLEGFLHVKDLVPMLSGDKTFDVQSVLRSLLFVPQSMKLIDLLAKMRASGGHMAIVVDEYGGTDGLVTMEDVVEEIVGEIHDEHDDDEAQREFIRIAGDVVDVQSRVRIERLERELGLNLISEEKEEDFETLGGLIFFQLGRVPAKGERIPHHSGIEFEILESDPRRLHRVRIHMHPKRG